VTDFMGIHQAAAWFAQEAVGTRKKRSDS